MMPITLPAFLQNPQITGIVRSADVPTRYIGKRWFPDEGVDADEFDSLVMLDQVHLSPFVAVDAETPVMPDDILAQYRWSVAYSRFKKRFKESDLRVFLEPGVSDPNSLTASMARASEAKIRRYVDALSISIDAREEWMFASAIGGSLVYADNQVRFTIAYDGAYIGTNRQVPGTLWSAASPTPVTDLSNWIDTLSDEADIEEWTLVLPRRVLGVMARAQEVRQLWSVATNNPAFADPDSLNPVTPVHIRGALTMLGINEVIVYNSKYTTRDDSVAGQVTRTKNRFLADTDIFLLPANETLGRTASAPSQANNWRPGKFGWSAQMQDPWVTEVGAGKYSLIDFPPTSWNKVLQARVL
jgi:hypothetical protein